MTLETLITGTNPQVLLPVLLLILLPIIIWDLAWKIAGCWKAAKNNQFVWFVCIFVINSLGILPIIYIYFFQNKSKKRLKRKSKKN